MRRDHLDADDANPGVVLASVVDPVLQVAEPRLELRAVVLLDQLAVRDDAGDAADRGPLARGVDERDVDVRVLGEVVRLARLVVAVEEQVDATVLLLVCQRLGCEMRGGPDVPWPPEPCIAIRGFRTCWRRGSSSCQTCIPR